MGEKVPVGVTRAVQTGDPAAWLSWFHLRTYGSDFFGQIDPSRAPGDAASATNATEYIKLGRPLTQFMGQPLAVACPYGWPGITTKDTGVKRIET